MHHSRYFRGRAGSRRAATRMTKPGRKQRRSGKRFSPTAEIRRPRMRHGFFSRLAGVIATCAGPRMPREPGNMCSSFQARKPRRPACAWRSSCSRPATARVRSSFLRPHSPAWRSLKIITTAWWTSHRRGGFWKRGAVPARKPVILPSPTPWPGYVANWWRRARGRFSWQRSQKAGQGPSASKSRRPKPCRMRSGMRKRRACIFRKPPRLTRPPPRRIQPARSRWIASGAPP